MEKAWLEASSRHNPSPWSRGFIQRMLRQFGPEYDFLFSDHGAHFIPNRDRHPQGRAEATAESRALLVRFARDRGEFFVSIAAASASPTWVDAQSVGLLLQLEKLKKAGKAPAAIEIPAVSCLVRDHFSEIQKAFSPARMAETLQCLEELRNKRAAGELEVVDLLPDRGLVPDYRRNTSSTGRVPVLKTLGTYLLMFLTLPFTLFAVLLMWAIALLLKERGTKRRVPYRLYWKE